jgi:hypothetical protein
MRSYPVALLLGSLAVATLTAAPVSAQGETPEEWLAQCRRERDDHNRERVCEVRSETFRAGAGALKVNSSPNGGAVVESWSGATIEVEARIQTSAPDRSRAEAIAKDLNVAHNGNTLAPEGPSQRDRESWSVVYYIKVPRQTDLELRTTNGPLAVRNVRGRIMAVTTNGPISLTDVAGDVNVKATNGPVSVRLSGTRWEGAGLSAETTNGPVTLSIPRDYNADLETGTENGPFVTDVPLTVTMLGKRSSHINTKLGDGGAPVRVVTTNGPVSIHRR